MNKYVLGKLEKKKKKVVQSKNGVGVTYIKLMSCIWQKQKKKLTILSTLCFIITHIIYAFPIPFSTHKTLNSSLSLFIPQISLLFFPLLFSFSYIFLYILILVQLRFRFVYILQPHDDGRMVA